MFYLLFELSKKTHVVNFQLRNEELISNFSDVTDEEKINIIKEGIKIAGVISSILENKNRLFYIDEQFVHVHPEIEKTIISVIIDLIGKESQVFFTTHNLEILDMNLPIHSFIFLHRDKYITEVVYPEKILVNKNDRGLKNLAENNLFNTIPDVSLLETISEE